MPSTNITLCAPSKQNFPKTEDLAAAAIDQALDDKAVTSNNWMQ